MNPYQLIFGRRLLPGPNGTIGRGEPIAVPLSKLTHTYLKGKTGAGKTSLISEIGTSLLWQKVGFGLIDPTGDPSRRLLKRLVAKGFYDKFPDAFERFMYLDIARAHKEERYLPMGLTCGNYDPYTVADIVLTSFKRVWPALQDGTAINIEMLVRLGSMVISYCNKPLLPYLENFLTTQAVQQNLLAQVDDPTVRKWFNDLKLEPKKGYIPEIALTTLKRIYGISFAPVMRYMLSQQANILDFNSLLQKRTSFALNLRMASEEVQNLIGCLLTAQIETVVKSRGELTEEEEKYLFVVAIDEFQRFMDRAGQQFETIFTEGRKAKVLLLVSHQHDGQLSETVQDAVGQCNTIIAFKLDSKSAQNSVEQMGFPYNPYWVKQTAGNPMSPGGVRKEYFSKAEQNGLYVQWVMNLHNQEAFIRLPNNSIYKMETYELPDHVDKRRLEEVEQEYIRLYFRSKAEIDRKVNEDPAQLYTLSDVGSSQDMQQNDKLQHAQQPQSSLQPEKVEEPLPRRIAEKPVDKYVIPPTPEPGVTGDKDTPQPLPDKEVQPNKLPGDEYDLF